MLEQFQRGLIADSSFNSKHAPYYIQRIKECYAFFRIIPDQRLTQEQHLFLTAMVKTYEDWQGKQADTALRRYDFFLSQHLSQPATLPDHDSWASAFDKTRDIFTLDALRLEYREDLPGAGR